MQKIYEWRVHIGKAGTITIKTLWNSDLKYKNPVEHKAYVEFTLSCNLPFMYGKLEYLSNDQYKVWVMSQLATVLTNCGQASKSFLLPLVLQTFASHLWDIMSMDNNTYHKLIGDAMPKGVLVLAVISVCRE